MNNSQGKQCLILPQCTSINNNNKNIKNNTLANEIQQEIQSCKNQINIKSQDISLQNQELNIQNNNNKISNIDPVYKQSSRKNSQNKKNENISYYNMQSPLKKDSKKPSQYYDANQIIQEEQKNQNLKFDIKNLQNFQLNNENQAQNNNNRMNLNKKSSTNNFNLNNNQNNIKQNNNNINQKQFLRQNSNKYKFQELESQTTDLNTTPSLRNQKQQYDNTINNLVIQRSEVYSQQRQSLTTNNKKKLKIQKQENDRLIKSPSEKNSILLNQKLDDIKNFLNTKQQLHQPFYQQYQQQQLQHKQFQQKQQEQFSITYQNLKKSQEQALKFEQKLIPNNKKLEDFKTQNNNDNKYVQYKSNNLDILMNQTLFSDMTDSNQKSYLKNSFQNDKNQQFQEDYIQEQLQIEKQKEKEKLQNQQQQQQHAYKATQNKRYINSIVSDNSESYSPTKIKTQNDLNTVFDDINNDTINNSTNLINCNEKSPLKKNNINNNIRNQSISQPQSRGNFESVLREEFNGFNFKNSNYKINQHFSNQCNNNNNTDIKIENNSNNQSLYHQNINKEELEQDKNQKLIKNEYNLQEDENENLIQNQRRSLQQNDKINIISNINNQKKLSLQPKQRSKKKGSYIQSNLESLRNLPSSRNFEQENNNKYQLPEISQEEDQIIQNMKQTLKKYDIADMLGLEAKSYAVLDSQTCRLLTFFKGKKVREIASLTKIMTFYSLIQYCEQNKIKMENEKVVVSKNASSIIGTSANLRTGDTLTLQDLCYGLMLPSGNDAATAIAEHIGKLIYIDKYKENFSNTEMEEQKINNIKPKDSIKYFIQLMNQNAKNLKLGQTHYANPHGLVNKYNKSTCIDQARLSQECMKIDYFRKVVSTYQYTCDIQQQKNNKIREKTWTNTNKLLVDQKQYCIGIKTGITTAAGPCLASCFKIGGREIIVVVFNTACMEDRFTESWILIDFVARKTGLYDSDKQITNKNIEKTS